jgi:protein O-GlcNAc transferase
LPDVADDVLVADTRRYGEIVANKARPYQAWSNTPDANRPLRIGLVSGDFCNHPVGHFLEGVLSALHAQATGRLHLLAYATVARSDAVTNRLKAYCQVWRDVSALPDQHLAERIRADEVDILIDLSGHSAFNRLPMFAWKPAPVQATWLGYFASTGVAAIDYFLADPWSLPDGGASAFTEQIWCLPETRFCFTPPSERAPVSSLPAASNGHITFGCFNNLRKMNDSVVALWAQVLQQVAGSRLHLKAIQLDDEAVRQEVIRRFAAHGIAADRLSLAGPSPRAEYLQAYHQVDIALDPFPFTGGTTTAESLWMGVPVLTMAGRHLVSRQGLGLLMNAGLPGWVATDPQDYVDKAIAYAADLQALSTLRAGLRKQVLASPVFDAPRFAVAFEAALREMWVRWCAGRAQAF